MPRVLRCVLAFAVLLTAGCSSNSSTTTPSTTTPTTFTETFTGTLGPGELSHTHTFAASVAGTVTATLASLTPDTTAVIGMSLGTWDGTRCTDVLADDQTTQGITITATLAAAGNLCVRAYVVGPLPNAEAYQINAVHP
jgi:hypothetical protein